jgi:hypothetical protein
MIGRFWLCAALFLWTCQAVAQESLWIEAEHLTGVRGYCWPMGRPEMKQTDGHWALSGPGWAAEWTQGGESGFLSIATAADDDRAVATKSIDVPVAGKYFVWVRYGDWRETTERFQIKLEQAGRPAWTGKYGEQAVVEEDNELKLYWDWGFGWAKQEVELAKGPATLLLLSTTKEKQPRQVDVIVLTTDATYRPTIKQRPRNYAWEVLDTYRDDPQTALALEPLAKRTLQNELAPSWTPRTFRDRDFLFLWNTSHTNAAETWLSEKPERVKVPYNITDKNVREGFEQQYGGKNDVPIFSDPRIVPTFHGVGAGIFHTNEKTGEVNPTGQLFAKWLDANPDRAWAMMMNYHNGQPIGDAGQAMFAKYRDRYVGSISGESLGYFYPPAEEMKAATANAKTRRELVQAFSPVSLKYNADKYRKVYGKDLDKNPYEDVIACLSVGNVAFMPLSLDWGARTVGYESSAMTYSVLGMRWAFMRGGARQHDALTATYRSCNFGDASTIFSDTQSYHAPKNILDNYYSVYSGAGMTWYKMDIWYQYMAGASMFYHEQGFDEFWQPGGTSAAGLREVQLSPKGKIVDRFLRVTANDFDRGTPVTPVAFLVDYAHGWEPSPFWPNSFKNWHQHQDRFLNGDHEKMLEEYFSTAFHPIGRESERPITSTNEVYLPGVFGDVFDVIYVYPDVNKWRTIDTYPVVIVAGEIELTAAEGARLKQYVERGGTLLVTDAQLTGPGASALALPAAGEYREAAGYRWYTKPDEDLPSQRYRYRPIAPAAGQRVIASTADGDAFCVGLERGAGRLVYLSVPRGLGIDRSAIPAVAQLFAHLTRGQLPIEVEGDVNWLLNKNARGWMITLLNPAGQAKPQQGITPTDYRENRQVTIRGKVPFTSAVDRLLPSDKFVVKENTVTLEVPAGGVRIVELR